MTFRTLHRSVALAAVAFILASAVTGLLWAYAPHVYWDAGYMQRKHKAEAPNLSDARFGVQEGLARLTARFGTGMRATRATLRSDAGRLLYDFRYRTPDGQAHAALLDAVSGTWLSPLAEDDAIRFARQYVAGRPAVADAALLRDWMPRKANVGREAWRITFADSGATEIFIDPNDGAILEDQDSVRRFHFFIMKLHQFRFFGTHKELTILSGLPLIALILTGLWLAFPRARRALTRRMTGAGRTRVLSKSKERST